jgi:hypothetical protein
MDLVLAVLILGVAEVTILSLALRAFERAEARRARVAPPGPALRASQTGRFFADGPSPVPAGRASVEALLLQLEQHVRVEQAAAESFLRNPTPESLHRASSASHLAN